MDQRKTKNIAEASDDGVAPPREWEKKVRAKMAAGEKDTEKGKAPVRSVKAEPIDFDSSPLAKPGSAEKSNVGHEFGSITGYRKKSELPDMASDGPVNVRGPDEVPSSSKEGPGYVMARFNHKEEAAATEKKAKLEYAGAAKVMGPKTAKTKAKKDKEGNEIPGIEYFYLVAKFDIPDDAAPQEFIQRLKGKFGAVEVDGPIKADDQKRFQLVVQNRSGNTETKYYRSKEDALAGKAEIEKSISDNPAQGLVARKIKTGQSTIRRKGMSQTQYFSEKHTQMRKHADQLKTDGKAATRKQVAIDLGMELAYDPVAQRELKKKFGEKEGARQIDLLDTDLDTYMNELVGLIAKGAKTADDAKSLKPMFKGTVHGQSTQAKGRGSNSSHEYKWDENKGDWVSPVEFYATARGQKLHTVQRPEPQKFDDLTKKRDRGAPKKPGAVDPTRKEFDPSSKAYVEYYAKMLTALGKHYSHNPFTRDISASLLAVAKSAISRGSPTVNSIEDLSDAVEHLETEFTEKGEAELTPQGREAVKHAIDSVYRILSVPVPEYDEEPDEELDSPDDEDGQRALGTDSADGNQVRQRDRAGDWGDASTLPAGLRGRGKSQFQGYGEPTKQGDRKHVAVAGQSSGLPPKVFKKIPYEYRKNRIKTWDQIEDLWGANTPEAVLAKLTGVRDITPKNDAAWRTLQKKLDVGQKQGPEVTQTSFGTHKADDPKDDAEGEQGAPPPASAWKARDTKVDKSGSPDTPWRTLSKIHGKDDKKHIAQEPRKSGRTNDPDDKDPDWKPTSAPVIKKKKA